MATTYTLEVGGNEVHITPKPPDIVCDGLRETLSFTPHGAEHSPTHKSNQWIYRKGQPPKFNPRAHWDGKVSLFYKGRGKYSYFPTGVLPQALAYLRAVEAKTQLKFEVVHSLTPIASVDQTLDGQTVNLKGEEITITLYDYQIDQVQELIHAPMGRAMVESPTGSGKSVTISEYIYHFPTAVILVIVPSLSLLNQTADTIEGLIGEKVGRIGKSKFKPARVTVATVQTLASRRNKEEMIAYGATVDIAITDEAHLAASDRFKLAFELLPNTSRRASLSATIRREDGNELVFHGLLGPKVYSLSAITLINRGILARPIIELHTLRHDYRHDPVATESKKPKYPHVEEACIGKSEIRKALILKQAKRCKDEGLLPCIIMVNDSLELGDALHEEVAKLGATAWLSGEDDLKIRDQVCAQVAKGEIPFLICSTIFDEGVDIRQIRSVILAGGGTSGNKAAQRVGRGLRICPGKTSCLIIDIYDVEKYFLSDHATARKTWYEFFFPGCVTVMDEFGNPQEDVFRSRK